MHGNVPVRFGRGRVGSLGNRGLAAYLIRKVPRRVIDPRPGIRPGDEELGTRQALHRHSPRKDEGARALKKIGPEAEKQAQERWWREVVRRRPRRRNSALAALCDARPPLTARLVVDRARFRARLGATE